MRSLFAVVGALLLVGCGDGGGNPDGGSDAGPDAGTTTFTATLSGANESPPVTTSATGSATATLSGTQLTLTGSFSGLSSNANNAHIHGPADAGVTAPPICNLTYSAATSGTLSGSCAFSAGQVTELNNGQMYINVHSVDHGPGEIRGHLIRQ